MLLSSMAEAMYWCGRYVERAQALSRVISNYERLRLDLPASRPLDLKPLMALTNEGRVIKTPESRPDQLQALVFDEQNPSSVLGALTAARENLRSARSVAPPELWHVLNRAYSRLSEARGRSEAVVLEALEDTLAAGERFDGERASGMMRDAAFAFLTIGCQLERADMLLRSLAVLLPVLRPDGWERAFDDVRWTGLLNALGVTSSYRRRHHQSADFQALLALLLVDRDCPRSLAFCLNGIARQLRSLPHASRIRAVLPGVERDGAALTRAPSGQPVPDLPRALDSLAKLHEAVESSYFPGLDAETSELGGIAAPPGTPSDPFSYLGREHDRTQGLLRVLDELGAQAARGSEVNRADLGAIVGFLTDYGELSHHEKEESILTPELVAGGFDWYDGPLAVMRREHQQEHYFVRALSHLASQQEPWSAETTRSFVSIAREFCHFMRSHIDHEHRNLFEQASRSLTAEAKSRLLAAFIAFDAKRAPVFSSGPTLDELLKRYVTSSPKPALPVVGAI
jgi:uncharacterized alpha-E superfamily protein/hemerythrin-like domain-containing protein